MIQPHVASIAQLLVFSALLSVLFDSHDTPYRKNDCVCKYPMAQYSNRKTLLLRALYRLWTGMHHFTPPPKQDYVTTKLRKYRGANMNMPINDSMTTQL